MIDWARVALLTLVALAVVLQVVQVGWPNRGTLSPHCNDGRVCTADVLSPDAYCMHYDYPDTHRCQDACHVHAAKSTFCNGSGGCVASDPRDCRGYCARDYSADCDNAIPLDTTWITSPPCSFFEIPWIWTNYSLCFGHRCSHVAIDLYATSLEGGYPYVFSGIVQCREYLARDFLRAHGDCLHIERYLLDANLTDMFVGQVLEVDDFPSSMFQFSACVYTYACSAIDVMDVQELFGITSAAAARAAATVNMTRFVRETC